ncbi:MAG TPA: SprT family zinc-dependent metalloprotease [Anaerolineales bacterium]|nr:SprT family zinc-dependent metalloprotease [Anaerolineales bacterium]
MIVIDEVVRTRRRTLAIIIQEDGRLVVRAPLRARDADIHEFVRTKERWIRTKQEQARNRAARFVPKRYAEGEQFFYLGDLYPLQLEEHQSRPLVFNSGFHLSTASTSRAAAHFERWYRRQALRVMTERAEHYAASHGFEFHKIKITGARKQWGACGPGDNLRFAWRLVMAPLPIIDYVVVHELAHLHHHNHSKTFWRKVKSILPDFREREAWLDEYGHLLRLA